MISLLLIASLKALYPNVQWKVWNFTCSVAGVGTILSIRVEKLKLQREIFGLSCARKHLPDQLLFKQKTALKRGDKKKQFVLAPNLPPYPSPGAYDFCYS